MIRTIQADMKSTVRAMEEGTVQVQDGVQSTVQAGDSLREIIHTAEQVGEMVTHIATAGPQQSATSEHVKERMQQIAMLVNQAATEAWNSAGVPGPFRARRRLAENGRELPTAL